MANDTNTNEAAPLLDRHLSAQKQAIQESHPSQGTRDPHDEQHGDAHTLPLQALYEQLNSSSQGLTSPEAKKRLAQYGPNDTTGLKHTSPIFQFLRLFTNPLVAILLVACVVSAILGDKVNASIIFVILQQRPQFCANLPITERRKKYYEQGLPQLGTP